MDLTIANLRQLEAEVSQSSNSSQSSAHSYKSSEEMSSPLAFESPSKKRKRESTPKKDKPDLYVELKEIIDCTETTDNEKVQKLKTTLEKHSNRPELSSLHQLKAEKQ